LLTCCSAATEKNEGSMEERLGILSDEADDEYESKSINETKYDVTVK